MDPVALEIGRALRRTRLGQGLTLRDVTAASGGRFKATSVAGYERGERSITLERFCDLCAVYGVAPERLLGEIVRAVEGRPEPEVNLAALEAMQTEEGALIAGFIREIRGLRHEHPGETIVLRAGDLEVLATASGKRPEQLLELLRPRTESD